MKYWQLFDGLEVTREKQNFPLPQDTKNLSHQSILLKFNEFGVQN